MQLQQTDQSHFGRIPASTRPRSQWLRPSRTSTTFDEGELVPFYLDDVLPGDTFNVQTQAFARLATPIFPIMTAMYMEFFYFFIPNRLVWTNFVRQMGERPDPDSSVDFTTPIIDQSTGAPNPGVNSLWGQFGLPTGVALTTMALPPISALPFRGYYLVHNEWFRDQDYQDSLVVSKGDGPDLYSAYTLQRINKFFDYITGARPAPQKGPAVEMPIAGTAPVSFTGDLLVASTGTGVGHYPAFQFPNGPAASLTRQATPAVGVNWSAASGFAGVETASWSDPKLRIPNSTIAAAAPTAVLSMGTGPTVNQMREAVTIQQFYELDMRGGTRYTEFVFNHFGATNPDFRLQRPEFLGYSKSPVNIHPVQQTSESSGTSPQGNLAAFGTASSRNGFVKSFTEHGYVLGLVAVRADLSYQNKVDRHWTRQTRFDYYDPIFANLGEQVVFKYEWSVDLTGATTADGSGYQERWAEYRFKSAQVNGLFRSNAFIPGGTGSLDAWGLWQQFANNAAIDGTFMQENAPVDRTIAIPSEPHFIFDSIINNISARVMPTYSVPGLMRI